ncbi:MAG: hypothetical protein K1X94_06805 [Sandaracinaceae bacterium]|nr:hypothetical protein [Sandaracinaceae bacterium]
MWSVRCERCGAPAEVAIAPPRIVRCASCGSTTPASAALEAQLDRAANILTGIVARTARLDGAARRIVGLGRRALVFLAVPWLFAVVMLGLVGGLNLASALGADGQSLGRACVLLPLGLMLFVTGGTTLLTLGSRILEIETHARAEPAVTPGEPATCPVCGGGLPPHGLRAVVGCGYCKSEVVVDPRLLARAERRTATSLDALERTLDARAAALAAAGFGRVLWILGGAVILSFALAVCGGVLGALLDMSRILTS